MVIIKSDYIKNNIKKTIPQIVSIVLGIVLMYGACFFGGGFVEGIFNELINPYKKISIIQIKGSDSKTIERIKGNSNVKDIIKIIPFGFTVELLIEQSHSFIFGINSENIHKMMDYMGDKLIEGRLPGNEDEVLLNKKTMNAMSFETGDYIGKDLNENHPIRGRHLIKGVYKGEASFIYSSVSQKQLTRQNYFLVFTKDMKYKEMNTFLRGSKNNINVWACYKENKNQVNTLFKILDLFGIITLLIIIFVISVTLGNIRYLYFTDRISEFALFECLGYRKKTIKMMLFYEFLFISFTGLVVGLLLSFMGGWLFNALYAIPRGTPVTVIKINYILFASFIPISTQLISLKSIKKYMHETDLVEVLDGL
jgi:ABC-type lipoprotein release transport system permease subunit